MQTDFVQYFFLNCGYNWVIFCAIRFTALHIFCPTWMFLERYFRKESILFAKFYINYKCWLTFQFRRESVLFLLERIFEALKFLFCENLLNLGSRKLESNLVIIEVRVKLNLRSKDHGIFHHHHHHHQNHHPDDRSTSNTLTLLLNGRLF